MSYPQDILSAFEHWNEALQSGCAKTVASLYHESAILLPTISDLVRRSPQEIEDYFEFFLQNKPIGHLETPNVRVFDDLAINSGVYRFVLNGNEEVTARYTFVYQRIDNQWQIIEHHSSQMPEALMQ